jgi:hypothetical protein
VPAAYLLVWSCCSHLVVADILVQGLVEVELVALRVLGQVDLDLDLVHQHVGVAHADLYDVLVSFLLLLHGTM